MKISKDELYELDVPFHGSCVVYDNIVDTSRWSEIHEVVFKYKGSIYMTSYRTGLTEMQDERPWEGESEVECQEVAPVEETVIVYKPIK